MQRESAVFAGAMRCWRYAFTAFTLPRPSLLVPRHCIYSSALAKAALTWDARALVASTPR
jgi:hypothetical protein